MTVLPAKVGVRSKPVIKVTPLLLTLSQQMRFRRKYGSNAYSEDSKELRLEVAANGATPAEILQLLQEVTEVSAAN